MPTSRTTAMLLAVLLALLAVGGTPATAAAGYRWPVDADPVRGFRAPPDRYAAGHRGVDLPVTRGEPVRPMAPGTVTFAGSVAGSRWVTVGHADGIRTSYGPLATITVSRGEDVGADATLGAAAADAHVAGSGRLHVGARRGDDYLDPAILVGRPERVPTLVGPGSVAATAAEVPDDRVVLVPGTPPSPNHLVVVAGLTSATGQLPFDPAALGYTAADTSQFSYAGAGPDGEPLAYDAEDTWQRVHDAALALRDQLRARWADRPGQATDLVGHSLGGLVSLYYLLVLHDPADPTLPPIGKVVTLASPLEGADVAAVVNRLRGDPVAAALVELVDGRVPELDDDAPVLTDLEPGSAVTEAVADAWRRYLDDPYASPLANGTDVLTVGGLLDPVVPAHRTDLPGAPRRTVIDDHAGTPTHPTTLDAIEAFVAGQPLPAPGPASAVADLASPLTVGVSVAEQVLGALIGALL